MKKEDEQVLVLARGHLASILSSGIKQEGLEGFEDLIKNYGRFKKRGEVEEDPNWKQVIPYLVFKYEDQYWLMQRTTGAGEERLHNLYTLGIGGHVRQEDLRGKTIADWAKREFDEEIEYRGSFVNKPIGLLNDESTPVNRVHLGYVILLEGGSDQIKVREDHNQKGKLLTLTEIGKRYPNLEIWSQIVFDFLKGKND